MQLIFHSTAIEAAYCPESFLGIFPPPWIVSQPKGAMIAWRSCPSIRVSNFHHLRHHLRNYSLTLNVSIYLSV